jgi:hypothetical protein
MSHEQDTPELSEVDRYRQSLASAAATVVDQLPHGRR